MSVSVELIRYMAMQQASLQELHSLMKDEELAIIALDIEKMQELNILKESAHQRHRSILMEGQQLISSIAKQTGLKQDVRLSQVIEKMEPGLQAELSMLQNGLIEIAGRVKELAKNNRQMLERFLGTVNESLAFILRVLNSSSMYGSSGVYLQQQRTAAMMVNREA